MSDNIKVAIRVRPLIKRERDRNSPSHWGVRGENCIEQVSSSENFYFDRVFNSEDENETVYGDLCYPIVKSVMEGFNGTIFAYGQTSSGKTYTMMGEHSGIVKGVLHYTIEDIFNMIQDMPDREFLLRVSFIEIYNERVYDLLSNKNEDLKIMEDAFGVVKVNGVEEKIVLTSEQILHWMKIGLKKRHTGETQMNRTSSRSHSIFRMIIESRLLNREDAVVNVSQLNLVDLAGSENVKQTKTKGDRFKEGIHINLSLSTLSQVISQLSEKEDQFINYRNSKLTRLLQNSLGGNALTAIICNVTPTSLRETLSTVYFATRAKKIKNKPEKNEILTDQAMLRQYANKIKKLTQQLEASKEQGKELEEKTKQNENLKRQIEALKANFITYIVPEKRNKALRRETWGGRYDAQRLQLVISSANETTGNGAQLTTVEEEAEDGESTDLELFSFKDRTSWLSPTKRTRCSGIRKILNAGTQTDCGADNDVVKSYDEAMTMVSELKSQLTTLQNGYTQLTEYTTLEKQCLKASIEHAQELQALKKENDLLKEKIALSKKESYVSDVEERKNIPSCDSSKRDLQEMNHSVESELNKGICLGSQTSISFADSSKFSNEKSGLESTLMDETAKSHFLAMYDECVDSETEQLKAEIDALKRDCDWKDNQINVLREQIEAKSKPENDHKILSKETENPNYGYLEMDFAEALKIEMNKLKKDNEAILHTNNMKDQQIKVLNDEITSLLDMKLKLENELVQVKKLSGDIEGMECDNDLKEMQIQLLKDKLEIKEQMISSLKDEITLNQTYAINKMDISAQTSVIENDPEWCCKSFKECQTSPYKFSQEECSSPKRIKLSIDCQTSPELDRFDQMDTMKSSQAEETSHSDSDDCEGRISPLGLYLLETDAPEGNLQKKSWKDAQTTPIRIRDFHSPYKNVFCGNKFIQTSPFLNCDRTSACDCSRGSSNKDLSETKPDELKITKSITELKDFTFEILKSCFGTLIIDGVSETITNQCLLPTAEQEIGALKDLISRLEFHAKDLKEHSDLLNQKLDSKFEEVISLEMRVSEAESNFRRKEVELSNLSEKILNMKGSLSDLSFICSMLKNIESADELMKFKQSSNRVTDILSRNERSSPLHNLIFMEGMLLKLDSCIKDNASQIIELRESLKKAQDELFLVGEKPYCPSRSSQTDLAAHDLQDVRKLSETEKTKLVSQFEDEIMQLKEKNYELLRSNKELKSELESFQLDHSNKICSLTADHEAAKADWEVRTRELVKDLEAKYDEELNEQEDKLEMLKKQHIKELAERESEFKKSIGEMKLSLNKELLDARNKINELSHKYSNICKEDSALRRQLEKRGDELQALLRKHFEEISYWKRKWMSIKQLFVESELKNKAQAKDTEAKIEELKKGPDVEQTKEKINAISSERDALLKKYTLAKQHILEMKQEIKNKEHEIGSTKDMKTTEEFKKLVNELDQKKAKIMSLETNNASMVREIKKLQEMSMKGNICHCKAGVMNSKSANSNNFPVMKSKSDPTIDTESMTDKKLSRKTASQGEQTHNICDSKEKEVDQEKILLMGGGSGPANMVKCFWLEGAIQKKDKEIAELQKKLADANSEVKSLKDSVVNVPEQKKALPVKRPVENVSNETMDTDVTIANEAFHPYQQGAIPKIQPKQVLKERNGAASKPYSWLKTEKVDKANMKDKVETCNLKDRRKENMTDVEAAKVLTCQGDCKQQ